MMKHENESRRYDKHTHTHMRGRDIRGIIREYDLEQASARKVDNYIYSQRKCPIKPWTTGLLWTTIEICGAG